VLYYVDHPRDGLEIADRSDNYRNTVNRILKRFRDRGLVSAFSAAVSAARLDSSVLLSEPCQRWRAMNARFSAQNVRGTSDATTGAKRG